MINFRNGNGRWDRWWSCSWTLRICYGGWTWILSILIGRRRRSWSRCWRSRTSSRRSSWSSRRCSRSRSSSSSCWCSISCCICTSSCICVCVCIGVWCCIIGGIGCRIGCLIICLKIIQDIDSLNKIAINISHVTIDIILNDRILLHILANIRLRWWVHYLKQYQWHICIWFICLYWFYFIRYIHNNYFL